MATIEFNQLRSAIAAVGNSWEPRVLPSDFKPRGLGWNPSPPETNRLALVDAQRLMLTRMPNLFLRPMSLGAAPLSAGPAGAPAGGPARPASWDWRTKGVIGPVTDQGYCGSCVSFAVTGLVGAMTAIEHASTSVHLSEADSHFNSSHGPNCGGWDNGTALNQIKARGVVANADLTYASAFDTPPADDHNFPEGDAAHRTYLWLAHQRNIAARNSKIYKVEEVTAWTGDDRKTYLANVGPLTCGFTVYEDFDSYGGGVYKHATGNVRGGHAVLVIGYDDNAQCWICRNSWGTGFGGAARADGTGGGFFKIGYGQCGIDNEAFYGAQGVVGPAPAGWGGWWDVAGGVAAANTSVFGVSRSANKLDVMCVGTDHGTYTAAWQPGFPKFQGWWRVQGGVSAANSSVSVVSRSADKLDAFCVGTDQHIYTAAWQPGATSWGGWWPVQGGVAAPGTSVFGVSRGPDKLDIFCVGSDHGIYTAAWQPGNTTWHGWWRVQGGSAAPNTSVTAVSRSLDKLDIFCVGTDQRIYTAAWQSGDTTWRGWWPVQGGVAAPGTSVFGVSRGPDKLDIFCVGTDMQVYTAAWQAGDTSWRGWWPVGHFKAAPNSSVYAITRGLDHLDIFAVGQDGGIYSASWQAGDTKWRGWWRILDGVAAPGTTVTAVSRSAGHMDVFCVGSDHHIYTAGWQG